MKLIYFLVISIVSICTVTGQSLYEAGYFIDNSGKKTEALIKKLPWRDSPTEFEWKKTISSSVQTANIEDVKEFSVGEDYRFKRYILKFDLNGDTLGKSTRSEDPNLKIRKVFLRLVVKSETSLYQYSLDNVHRFFYTNTANVYPELLVYKVFYEDDESKDLGEKIIPKENKTYIEQLKKIAFCEKLKPEKVEYNQSDLKNYFVSYNECKGNKILYILRRKINQTRVGIIAAANLTSFNHQAGLQSLNEKVNYSDQLAPRYGVFIESFIPFSKVDLSFFLEATYQSLSMEGNLLLDGDENITYDLDYKALNLALAPRFHIYLSPKFTFFLEGGIAVDFNLGSSLGSGEVVELQNATTNYFYGGGFGSGRLKIGVRLYTTKNISKDTALPETFMDTSSVYAAFTLFGHRNKGG